MKPKSALKIGIGAFMIVALCFVTLKSFAHKSNLSEVSITTDNVVVTIDKKTTKEGFEDIKSMLKDHGITAQFNDITRNDLAELTGLKIELKDGKSGSATSKISSNVPISEITFGRKDGILFITPGKNGNESIGFLNPSRMPSFSFDTDSIIGQNFNSFGGFNLNDFFNEEGDSSFFGGTSMNFDKMRAQMQQFMQQQQLNGGSFKFYDDPKTNKLIIIDGKESNFNTLDKLSKEHKLAEVDNLKPKTAMSIYGNKAKDGAIIAITK